MKKKFLEEGKICLECDKSQSFELDFEVACYNSIYPSHGSQTGDDSQNYAIACIETAESAGHDIMVTGYKKIFDKTIVFASKEETEIARQNPSGIIPALNTMASLYAVAKGASEKIEEFRQQKLEEKRKNVERFEDYRKFYQNLK